MARPEKPCSYDWDSLIGREMTFIRVELNRLIKIIEEKDKELDRLRTSEDYYRTSLGLKEVLEKENE